MSHRSHRRVIPYVRGWRYAGQSVTESEFSDSIRSGLGRAILYARTNDVEPFRNVILDACLHCYSADPQSEGTRAPCMLELVKVTKNPEFFYEEIRRSLENCGDDWDAVQRFRLASYMAMDGDEHSKRVMYLSFHPGPKMVEETAIDFVRMDGIDGLLFAAEREGALLRTNARDVEQGYLLSHAIESFGEEQTLYALRCAAETNPNIAALRLSGRVTPGDARCPQQVDGNSIAQLRSTQAEIV